MTLLANLMPQCQKAIMRGVRFGESVIRSAEWPKSQPTFKSSMKLRDICKPISVKYFIDQLVMIRLAYKLSL
ncbi:MAG: hypothetical protein CL912_31200 [Deltaproteobacteria bacterium]|nr:hypothetical protein [Deltaproteobacteria bacterium]